MELTEREKTIVSIALEALCRKSYDDLHCMFGSETIDEIYKLKGKIKCDEFCKERGIKYEDMTEDDHEAYFYWMEDRRERQAYEAWKQMEEEREESASCDY